MASIRRCFHMPCAAIPAVMASLLLITLLVDVMKSVLATLSATFTDKLSVLAGPPRCCRPRHGGGHRLGHLLQGRPRREAGPRLRQWAIGAEDVRGRQHRAGPAKTLN